MNYLDILRASFEKFRSILSLGLDPILENIPINSGSVKERIICFYESILNKITQKRIYPSVVKPNYAFYAQYGMEGIDALISIIELFKSAGYPIILDVKRGDILKTADAYSREAFQFFKADAVTLSPYFGFDSISPFIENYPDKGYYILNKTSNNTSIEIQDILVNGIPLFLYISEKIIDWHHPGIGAVVGATFPDQLNSVVDTFIKSKREIPLLIPGIGSQMGSIEDVVKILTRYNDIKIHRINSSSAITYAYKKYKSLHFAEAAVNEIDALNEKISLSLLNKSSHS